MPSNQFISIVPFSPCLQYFSGSGSFPISQFLASGGQSIGVSASASVLPMNIQDWIPVGLSGFILAVQRTHKSLLQYHSSKAPIFGAQLSKGFFDRSVGKESTCNAGGTGLIPGWEKVMVTHSSALAWKIPWMEEPVRLQPMGSQRVVHDWATSLSLFFLTSIHDYWKNHNFG